MKQEYIVTNEYLRERGLDLNDYALEGTLIDAIINLGLDLAISRCCELNDNFKGEKSIKLAIDNDQNLIDPFKKLQYRVIYNLIFQNETSPIDQFIDTIIAHELGWGKINGYQKGLYYRHN